VDTAFIRAVRKFRCVAVSSTTRGGVAAFVGQRADGTRPRRSARFDSELSHFINQRRSRQSKSIGGSALSPNEPVGLLQGFQDVLAVGVRERA
jgi:hypothetical protein